MSSTNNDVTAAGALRPMCFVAMPFGRRAPAGQQAPLIDFDSVHAAIDRGARAAGLEPIRADFELYGDFIHKPMLERLLVAEYVVADLTLGNPNVLYEVGVRHGASARATLLVCAQDFIGGLPFDVRSLPVLPYDISADGSFTAPATGALAQSLEQRLRLARSGELPPDNPLMQITAWRPTGAIDHAKTDVFLQRLASTGALGDRIQRALALP
jgi:hypothetical protein